MQVREILPSGQGYLVRVVDGGLEPKTGLCVYTYRRDLAPQSGDVLEATVRLEAAFDNADFDDASFAKSRGVYLYATIVSGEAFEWRERRIVVGRSRAVFASVDDPRRVVSVYAV